jgi:hypothetical protein
VSILRGARPGEDIEKRLSRIEDVEAIRNVKSMYAFWCDKNYNPEEIGKLFTEDAKWESNALGNYYGLAEIKTFMAGISERLTWAHHFMINPMIEVADDGRTATGKWALIDLVTLVRSDTGKKDSVVITADYADTFTKLPNGEWRFQSVYASLKLMAPIEGGWADQELWDI